MFQLSSAIFRRIQLFLGAFANLRKTTLSFMSVCPSVRMEQLVSQMRIFYVICYLGIFRKNFRESANLMKI